MVGRSAGRRIRVIGSVTAPNTNPRHREWIIRNSPVPIGTCDLQGAAKSRRRLLKSLTWEFFRDTLIEQSRGRASTISHPTLASRLPYVPNGGQAVTGNRFRAAGSIMAKWGAFAHHKESFLYETFRRTITEIMKAYDICLRLGDRPCAPARLPTPK